MVSSLRFAPVIRKQPAKSATKPFAVPFSATVSVTTKSGLAATAFAPDDDHDAAASNPTNRTMHIPGRAKAALNAPAPATRTSKAPSVFARKGGGGDVNGFAQSEAGRKLALRAARNSKKVRHPMNFLTSGQRMPDRLKLLAGG
ncbi:hypothetical protein H4Q26_006832 [Puccinia striiformis f. sp. tritici PST-130]|nr:hypothetical protein H4Q26_006832 [Puccinia striiformis f. sp. tritici PST-130]